MDKKGCFMVAPYVAIFRALFEEVKEKRKTEGLSLNLIKEATRIKCFNDEAFKEDVFSKQQQYFGMMIEILELNSTKSNALVLEIIEQFIKDELIQELWFSKLIKVICKTQMKEEIRSKFTSVVSLIFESNRYLHFFMDGSLIELFALLFEQTNKLNVNGVNDNLNKLIFKVFTVANQDCIDKKDCEENSIRLINDLCLLLNELCNLVVGNKSQIFKNNKTTFSTSVIENIVTTNPQLFSKLNCRETLSNGVMHMCVELLDNSEYDQSLYSLINCIFTHYQTITNFMELFSKVLSCVSKEKSKEVQFVLLQSIQNHFTASFKNQTTNQLLHSANEFCKFSSIKYKEFISDIITIPFTSFSLAEESIETIQNTVLDESICCIITKSIIGLTTFLLADKETLLSKQERYQDIFIVVEQQLNYFIQVSVPISLFKEYSLFVFNVISLLISSGIHQQTLIVLNTLINATQLVPLQLNIIQHFNEKHLACVECLERCIKEFSHMFSSEEFGIVMPFLSSIKVISSQCELIKTNTSIIELPNFFLHEFDSASDELYLNYIATLVNICTAVSNNYHHESFKVDKYYFDQLYGNILLHPSRFLLTRNTIKPLFILNGLHPEESINSYFFDTINSILSQYSTNSFQREFILFLFDITINIISSSNAKAKRGIIDIYSTFIEHIINVINNSIDKLFDLLSFSSNYDIVGQSFSLFKEICKQNILRTFSPEQLHMLFGTLKSYLNQNIDLNIALSAVELQWGLLELLSQTPEIKLQQEKQEILMMELFNELLNEIEDERYDIWFSAAQTLLRAINDQGIYFKEDGWRKLITEVFYSAFQKLKVIVYPAILKSTDIPRRDDIQKTLIISRVSTEIRRWNDSVTANLSCVMRSLKLLFEKFSDEETKKQVYRYLLGFTDFAFFQPIVNGIEIGVKYIFNLMSILYDTSIFKEIDESLVDDSIDVIEMIHEFLLFNNGIFSGTTISFLNLLCDCYTKCSIKLKERVIEMIKKYICLFPGDFYVAENSGTMIQQRCINCFNDIIKDKDFKQMKKPIENAVIWCLDTVLSIEKIKKEAKMSKWWGINELMRMLTIFELDEQITERIIKSHDMIISLFNEKKGKIPKSGSDEKLLVNKSIQHKVDVHQTFFDIIETKLKTIDHIDEIIVKIIEITQIGKYQNVPKMNFTDNDDKIFISLLKILQLMQTKSVKESSNEIFCSYIDKIIIPSLQFRNYGRIISKDCYQFLLNCYLGIANTVKKEKCSQALTSHFNVIVNGYVKSIDNYREQWCVSELFYVIENIFQQLIKNHNKLGNGINIQWIYSVLVQLISSSHQSIRELIQPQLQQIGELYFQ